MHEWMHNINILFLPFFLVALDLPSLPSHRINRSALASQRLPVQVTTTRSNFTTSHLIRIMISLGNHNHHLQHRSRVPTTSTDIIIMFQLIPFLLQVAEASMESTPETGHEITGESEKKRHKNDSGLHYKDLSYEGRL